MAKVVRPGHKKCALLEARLADHLRCLRGDATGPALSCLERLGLVRERMARVREIRRALAAMTDDLG